MPAHTDPGPRTCPATAAQRGPLPDYLPADQVPDITRVRAPTGDPLWLVTRFELGRRVLTDHRFSRAAAVMDSAPAVHPMRPDPNALTSLDAPAHSRLRRLVSRAFTPHALAGVEDGIRRSARALLWRRERFDLVRDYAMPLSAATICRVLGVPPSEQGQFSALADRALGITPRTPGSPDEGAVAQRELRTYIASLVARAGRNPGAHLLGALVQARDADGALTEPELAALVELLLNAGYETSIGQLSLCVLALLEHPAQWRQLTLHPESVPTAVEELLRYAPVVPISFTRVATEPVVLGGTPVGAGEAVLVSLLHANFDPRIHLDPGTLLVDRSPARHLTFGHGAHVCLGAQLARIQLCAALEELAVAAPGLSLAAGGPGAGVAQEPPWRSPDAIVRGPASLPVRIRR